MKRNERLQTAVDRLASLTEGGHLLASTDPATLINTVVDKYLELRAKAAKWDRVEDTHEFKFVRHIESHLSGNQVPICTICGKTIFEIALECEGEKG